MRLVVAAGLSCPRTSDCHAPLLADRLAQVLYGLQNGCGLKMQTATVGETGSPVSRIAGGFRAIGVSCGAYNIIRRAETRAGERYFV